MRYSRHEIEIFLNFVRAALVYFPDSPMSNPAATPCVSFDLYSLLLLVSKASLAKQSPKELQIFKKKCSLQNGLILIFEDLAMKILLTGATGFLGSHLLEMLASLPNTEVIVLKRSFSNTARIKHLLNAPSVSTFNVDQVELVEIFNNRQIDIIIHTATEYGRNETTSLKTIETNLLFPIKLIELAIQNGTSTFINTDSYFNKENFSYSHLINYSLSKKVFLQWLIHFSKKIKICNLVLEHIYGEGDDLSKFAPAMINDIVVEKKPLVNTTYGHQKRDFIYVKDVVNAYKTVINYALTNNFRFKTGCQTHETASFYKIKSITNELILAEFS